MKILIFADSLALAREPEGGNIRYEETYPFLLDVALKQRYGADAPLVNDRGMRSRTIEHVIDHWFEEVELKNPDMVVIHVGIVDCAPRVFLRRERGFIENLRSERLRRGILNFVHKHRSRIIELRKKVYVPPHRFKALLDQAVSRAVANPARKLLFVNIISPSDTLEARSPGFQSNVKLYNEMLAAHVNGTSIDLIDLNKIVWEHGGPDKLTVDGVHINQEVHKLLAAELESRVAKLFSNKHE